MPEPNLPPLRVNLTTREDTHDVISVPLISDRIPELPAESRRKLVENYDLRPEIAIQLVNEPTLFDFFNNLMKNVDRNPTKVANLLLNDLLTVLNKRKIDLNNCTITIEQLEDLTDLLLQKKINLDVCRSVLEEILSNGKSPLTIVREKRWSLVTDSKVITEKCIKVIENNPKLVKQYRDGKVKVLRALLGILTKTSDNKLDMSLASKKMEELLKK